jgi:hypothetical protein
MPSTVQITLRWILFLPGAFVVFRIAVRLYRQQADRSRKKKSKKLHDHHGKNSHAGGNLMMGAPLG